MNSRTVIFVKKILEILESNLTHHIKKFESKNSYKIQFFTIWTPQKNSSFFCCFVPLPTFPPQKTFRDPNLVRCFGNVTSWSSKRHVGPAKAIWLVDFFQTSGKLTGWYGKYSIHISLFAGFHTCQVVGTGISEPSTVWKFLVKGPSFWRVKNHQK